MQTLYISDLPLSGDTSAAWDAAETVLDEWTSERLGLDLSHDGAEARNADRGTSGRSMLHSGVDGSRLHLRQTRTVNPAHPLWAYDVTTWLCHDLATDPDRVVLRVRLSAHALHGRVAELPHPPAAPRVVRSLLDEHHIMADGYRLGHPRTIDASRVPELVAHLHDEHRRRPMLVLTGSSSLRSLPIDPKRTAARLAGLAHVVVLGDRATSHQLTAALGGTDLSVFGGAGRLYWPDMKPDARRSDHPLWSAERLTIGGPNRFADMLFSRLGRLSALTLGPPPLEAKLRQEAERARRAASASQLDTITRQYNEAMRELDLARAEAQSTVPDEDVIEDDWFAEHEKVIDELEQTANERNELQEQLEQKQAELAIALDNIRTIAVASSAGSATDEDDTDPDAEELPGPTTVGAAVEQAAVTCDYLEILPEALASARASEYPNPPQVLADLQSLNAVAAAWARDSLPTGGFEPALIERGVSGFRPGISITAKNQYAADYERSYENKTIMLGPHIAHGVGAVTAVMRIYWYRDNDNKILVVGHVGKKLRDDSNS